jgi:ABC-type glutathione transport system ATPase component
VLGAMAALLALPASTASHLLTTDKPPLTTTPSRVTVGRASLPREARASNLSAIAAAASGNASAAAAAAAGGGSGAGAGGTAFATTGHAARLLQQAAVAIARCEPLLLVGESGTGKTTLVQHLAALVRLCARTCRHICQSSRGVRNARNLHNDRCRPVTNTDVASELKSVNF